MTKHASNTRLARLGSALAAVVAAVDVAQAVRNRRMPRPGALDALGLDENTFRHMQLR